MTFLGDAMAAVVQGVHEVRTLIGQPPVIVGGLAVLSRLSNPYRATVDLDVVDRLLGEAPQLEVLHAAKGAEPVEPAAVLLPTPYGAVEVDALDLCQLGDVFGVDGHADSVRRRADRTRGDFTVGQGPDG